jgi:hypothetical protein
VSAGGLQAPVVLRKTFARVRIAIARSTCVHISADVRSDPNLDRELIG